MRCTVRVMCVLLVASCMARCDEPSAFQRLVPARSPDEHKRSWSPRARAVHSGRGLVSPCLHRLRLRGGDGLNPDGDHAVAREGSNSVERARSLSKVPVRLLRDVIRRVGSREWLGVLGTAEVAAGVTSVTPPKGPLPQPPPLQLAEAFEEVPRAAAVVADAALGEYLLPPGAPTSAEQASADRSPPSRASAPQPARPPDRPSARSYRA